MVLLQLVFMFTVIVATSLSIILTLKKLNIINKQEFQTIQNNLKNIRTSLSKNRKVIGEKIIFIGEHPALKISYISMLVLFMMTAMTMSCCLFFLEYYECHDIYKALIKPSLISLSTFGFLYFNIRLITL